MTRKAKKAYFVKTCDLPSERAALFEYKSIDISKTIQSILKIKKVLLSAHSVLYTVTEGVYFVYIFEFLILLWTPYY